MNSPESEQHQIDHLVDQGVHNYADAREAVTGVRQPVPEELRELAKPAVANTVQVEEILTDDFGGFTQGVNHEAQRKAMQNPEQVRINREGAARVRAIIEQNREK